MAAQLGEPCSFGDRVVHAFPSPSGWLRSGIGDFSAGLILPRGAGDPDAVAYHEPRLALAVRDAYGLLGPATPEQLTDISENWRPYRTWVTLLLRTQQEVPVAGALNCD